MNHEIVGTITQAKITDSNHCAITVEARYSPIDNPVLLGESVAIFHFEVGVMDKLSSLRYVLRNNLVRANTPEYKKTLENGVEALNLILGQPNQNTL